MVASLFGEIFDDISARGPRWDTESASLSSEARRLVVARVVGIAGTLIELHVSLLVLSGVISEGHEAVVDALNSLVILLECSEEAAFLSLKLIPVL